MQTDERRIYYSSPMKDSCVFLFVSQPHNNKTALLLFFIRSAPLPSQPTPNAHYYNGGRAQHCLVGCHRTEADFLKVSLLPSCTGSPFLCTSCAHAQCEGIIEQVRIKKCSYLGGRKRQTKEEEGMVSFFSVSIRRRRRRDSTAIPCLSSIVMSQE